MKNENPKPIKRHPALQPLSREHHHGLLLSWKIRTGFAKGVAPERIKAYCDWFFENHLLRHFDTEEQHVFPVLGNKEHPLVKRALREHGRLKRLFTTGEDLGKNLSLIEEELTAHIRFEERELFNEIQQVATAEQLAQIERLHDEQPFEEHWPDRFWE
ncbi:MAG: cation-binding protein [Saprospirales bacterium]|nr:cation-binding protein [Saprospirales bacterium]